MLNGCWKIFTPLLCTGSMPYFARAAKTSNSLPNSQFPTVLFLILATVLIPVSFQLMSVRPLLLNTCEMLMSGMPFARDSMRLDSQSIPNCACPPATTCSGTMLGPPGLIVTSRPAAL